MVGERDRELCGFCCDGNNLYCVEEEAEEWRESRPEQFLTVYGISEAGAGRSRPLDSVGIPYTDFRVPFYYSRPRVDSSHRVFVPCGDAGVGVFRCTFDRLEPADWLRCVRCAMSVAVSTGDCVYVYDGARQSVCLVHVPTDTVIRELDRPGDFSHRGYWSSPTCLCVLGETVLVSYAGTLVVYHNDSSTPDAVVTTPAERENVTSITTDGHSRFFCTVDVDSVVYMYILDRAGRIHRKMNIEDTFPHISRDFGNMRLVDCAMVQSQLCLGFEDGSIVLIPYL